MTERQIVRAGHRGRLPVRSQPGDIVRLDPGRGRAGGRDLHALGVADDAGAAAVGENRGELLELGLRVHRGQRRSGSEHAVDRDGSVEAVREHHRHPVAALDSPLREPRRDPVRRAIELREGERALLGDHCSPGGVAACRRPQVVFEGRRRQTRALALDVAGDRVDRAEVLLGDLDVLDRDPVTRTGPPRPARRSRASRSRRARASRPRRPARRRGAGRGSCPR